MDGLEQVLNDLVHIEVRGEATVIRAADKKASPLPDTANVVDILQEGPDDGE